MQRLRRQLAGRPVRYHSVELAVCPGETPDFPVALRRITTAARHFAAHLDGRGLDSAVPGRGARRGAWASRPVQKGWAPIARRVIQGWAGRGGGDAAAPRGNPRMCTGLDG